MAYRLRPGKPVAREVRRIAITQLTAAMGELCAVGDPRSDAAVHDARRHVKKVRALFRLARPSLAGRRASPSRLRIIEGFLAPIANAQGVAGTVVRVARQYPGELSPFIVREARDGLLQRWARVDQEASAAHSGPSLLA
jgi:hypothetical protein